MRINARFDDVAEQQIGYLTQTTGQTVSQVVREAVAQYYARVRAERSAGPTRLLALAGQARSGRGDLSTTYKQDLADLLQAKFGAAEPHPGDPPAPASPPAGAAKRRAAGTQARQTSKARPAKQAAPASVPDPTLKAPPGRRSARR